MCRFYGSRSKSQYFERNATNLSKLLQEQPAEGPPSASPSVRHQQMLVMGQTPVSRTKGASLGPTNLLLQTASAFTTGGM